MGKAKIKKDRGIGISTLFGVMICAVVLAVLSAISGILIYMLEDPLAMIDIGSLICLLVSGLISSFIIAKRAEDKKIAVALFSALLFSALMLGIGAICGAGSLSWRVVLNYVCYIGMALIGAWAGARKRRHKRR